jgi:hypothetical protein
MPTVTSLSEFIFNNGGPLTTTWTAPASCATTPHVYLALSILPNDAYWAESCSTLSLGDCYPSGSVFDEILQTRAGTPLQGKAIEYFSPGYICPDKWVTVGVAAKDAAGSVSTTGAFNPLATLTTSVTALTELAMGMNPLVNMLTEAIGPLETAVLCCPRYEAGTSYVFLRLVTTDAQS